MSVVYKIEGRTRAKEHDERGKGSRESKFPISKLGTISGGGQRRTRSQLGQTVNCRGG